MTRIFKFILEFNLSLVMGLCFGIVLSGCAINVASKKEPTAKARLAKSANMAPKNALSWCKEAAVVNLTEKGFELIYAAPPLKGSLSASECRIDIYAKKDGAIYSIVQELGAKKELLSFDTFDVPFYKFEISYAKAHEKDGIALAIVLDYYAGADIFLVVANDTQIVDFAALARDARSEFVALYPEFSALPVAVVLEKIEPNGTRVTIETVKF